MYNITLMRTEMRMGKIHSISPVSQTLVELKLTHMTASALAAIAKQYNVDLTATCPPSSWHNRCLMSPDSILVLAEGQDKRGQVYMSILMAPKTKPKHTVRGV